MEAARISISDLKKNASTNNEKMSGLSRTHEEVELRRLELETQLKTNKQVTWQLEKFFVETSIIQMLDASRSNETAGAERISKLQEEKKVLQVSQTILINRK